MLAARQEELPPLKIASVADDGFEDTQGTPEPLEQPGARAGEKGEDGRMDELCECLAWWVHTRKLYGAPRGPVSLLGKLRSGTRPLRNGGGGPDAACSSLLQAMYIAYLHEPQDALDREVFRYHYLERIGNVKVAAAELKIGRQHWYTLLRSFRRRVYALGVEIQAESEASNNQRNAR